MAASLHLPHPCERARLLVCLHSRRWLYRSTYSGTSAGCVCVGALLPCAAARLNFHPGFAVANVRVSPARLGLTGSAGSQPHRCLDPAGNRVSILLGAATTAIATASARAG